MASKEEIIRTMMDRDGLGSEEAEEAFAEGMRAVCKAIVHGSGVEDAFNEVFGLEPGERGSGEPPCLH